jgi:hypothetical protein
MDTGFTLVEDVFNLPSSILGNVLPQSIVGDIQGGMGFGGLIVDGVVWAGLLFLLLSSGGGSK